MIENNQKTFLNVAWKIFPLKREIHGTMLPLPLPPIPHLLGKTNQYKYPLQSKTSIPGRRVCLQKQPCDRSMCPWILFSLVYRIAGPNDMISYRFHITKSSKMPQNACHGCASTHELSAYYENQNKSQNILVPCCVDKQRWGIRMSLVELKAPCGVVYTCRVYRVQLGNPEKKTCDSLADV